jgi:uncharacterized protein YecE (DUF72 family)
VRRWSSSGPEKATRARRMDRDVFVYFDNDAEGHAPKDALRLRSLVERRARARDPIASPPRAPRRRSRKIAQRE